ncbi:MAG: hypothetical protein M3O30_08715 [Planctomycetota bacterium]|nr:hypothetical protein [Planctomycetota bacterium]
MSQINPFVGAIGQTPQAIERAANDRSKQIRRAQHADHEADTREDEFIHQVDDAGGLSAANNKDQPNRQSKPQPKPAQPEDAGDEPEEHIDLTA